MYEELNYVSSIQDNNIVITCSSKDKIKILKAMGAKTGWFQTNPWYLNYIFLKMMGVKKGWFPKNTWYLNYISEQDLVKKLETLRDNGFMFGGDAHGWPPAAVFRQLRQKYNLSGEIIEIVWTGPNKTLTYKT